MLDIEALSGGYGTDITKVIKHVLEEYIHVKNHHFLVIGSQLSWIEVILVSLNIGHITTMECNDYKTDHSKITILSPSDLENWFCQKAPQRLMDWLLFLPLSWKVLHKEYFYAILNRLEIDITHLFKCLFQGVQNEI